MNISVPEEPTDEMISRAQELTLTAPCPGCSEQNIPADLALAIWRAMITAHKESQK